jgi:hypothetical protein
MLLSHTILSLFNSLEMICRRCDVLYRHCFTQYTQSLLPIYLMTHSASTSTLSTLHPPPSRPSFTLPSSLRSLLSALYLSLLRLLPHKYRPLFPPPNPLLLPPLWEHFATQLLPRTGFQLLAEDRQSALSSHEIATQLLPRHVESFGELCRLLMMCHGLYGPIRQETETEDTVGTRR